MVFLFQIFQVKVALHPYLQLTQAVKSGDLVRFSEVVKKFADQFTSDHTYTLIIRLHHNVVKTAVRTISLAYSKITFADIAQKLLLDSPEDAEFIVAKVSLCNKEAHLINNVNHEQAIRDGVIEAVLDHDSGTMQSKDTSDVYSTRLVMVDRRPFDNENIFREPQIAFNQRIEFCLDLHNHSVTSLNLFFSLSGLPDSDTAHPVALSHL